jgi:hypothetical protein
MVENHKLPRVSYSLSLDNMPYAEGDIKGVADITSQLIGRNCKTSKSEFKLIFLGANIYFSSNRTANGLSKYSDKIQL